MKISFYDPEEQPRKSRDKNSSFTLDWVSELGWKQNPFSLQNRIAGMHEEEHEINLFFIKERKFGLITGPTGVGKSTLMQWLSGELDNRRGFRVLKFNADILSTDDQLRSEIADPFRGMFSKGKDIDTQALVHLLEKKCKKDTLVLLIEDADDFGAKHKDVLHAILTLPNVKMLMSARSTPKHLPADDELELEVEQRDAQQYQQILTDRIEAVGGSGMHPFTENVVERMRKETDNTQEFLSLAQETAIHIALNVLTGDDPEEEVVSKKKKATHKETSSGVKGKERTKYDDLIESLGEELTKE